VQHQPSLTEHQTAQFTSEWEAAVMVEFGRVCRGAAEFFEPTRGIWQNFLRKLWSQ